jgi:glycolate oxidase iron-sulfur subunit
VEYGKLVEGARAQIEQNYRRPWPSRVARSLVYRHLLPYPHRISAVARAARFYQRSGLQTLARASGLLGLLGFAGREKLMPRIENDFFFSQLGRTFAAQGPRRARVALFAGCISQVSFAALHEATIRVLAANGCEVVYPERVRAVISAGRSRSRESPRISRQNAGHHGVPR